VVDIYINVHGSIHALPAEDVLGQHPDLGTYSKPAPSSGLHTFASQITEYVGVSYLTRL